MAPNGRKAQVPTEGRAHLCVPIRERVRPAMRRAGQPETMRFQNGPKMHLACHAAGVQESGRR